MEEKNIEILNALNEDISKRSNNLLKIGIIVLFSCIGLTIFIYYNITSLLDDQICLIESAQSENKATLMTIYLVFRILTIGTIPTALLYFGYSITRASFDQSVRFAKRKHSALFWQFLHNVYSKEIKEISFENFIEAFDNWNKTTESSFTNIKISNKNHFGKALEILSESIKNFSKK
jgi:hypothetical protein